MPETSKTKLYHVFKGSSDFITRQTPLWRYMNFEKFCWLLDTSKLYHARLDQFHDPFEAAVTNAYARKRDAGEIEPYFSLKEYEPLIFKSLRFRQFATCWHAAESESDALWQVYAAGGAGIAVVSTIARIEQSVELPSNLDGLLGQVEYVDFDNHEMRRPSGTVIRPGHLKRRVFEHEKEVRGIILVDPIVGGSSFAFDEAFVERQRKEQPLGIALKVDLQGLIQSIVTGPLVEPFVEELVDLITERHGLEDLVRKSGLLNTPAY